MEVRSDWYAGVYHCLHEQVVRHAATKKGPTPAEGEIWSFTPDAIRTHDLLPSPERRWLGAAISPSANRRAYCLGGSQQTIFVS